MVIAIILFARLGVRLAFKAFKLKKGDDEKED
jgi:hypothetical protein